MLIFDFNDFYVENVSKAVKTKNLEGFYWIEYSFKKLLKTIIVKFSELQGPSAN